MVKEEKKSKVILGGMDMTKRGRNLVWPIFLIFVGVMLLLNSLFCHQRNIKQCSLSKKKTFCEHQKLNI